MSKKIDIRGMRLIFRGGKYEKYINPHPKNLIRLKIDCTRLYT